jgi:hypothetical protein
MKLPYFKTEAERRDFWKKHVIGDYRKDLQESDDTFERLRPTPVTLKFDLPYHHTSIMTAKPINRNGTMIESVSEIMP